MTLFDANLLAQRLEARYGLGLSGGTQEVEGGAFAAIRPVDLERPNGFAIVVARTPKIVEASLRLDDFTRSLLRQMSEADDAQRATFVTLANQAEADGFRIGVSVNENHVDSLAELPPGSGQSSKSIVTTDCPAGKCRKKNCMTVPWRSPPFVLVSC